MKSEGITKVATIYVGNDATKFHDNPSSGWLLKLLEYIV